MAFLVSIFFKQPEDNPVVTYRFDFDELDRSFWLISPWEDFRRDYSLVTVSGGVLKMSADIQGEMPYMLSQPIRITDGDVITLKRRVKISHGDDWFAGGLAMYQTSENELIPSRTDGAWFTSFGDGVFLIEYSYDLVTTQDRPGRDIVRFLASDWSYNDNYHLITPIYDRWYDEQIVFDTRSHQMTYTIDGKSYKLNSYVLDRDHVRFLMHPFGSGLGNRIEMEYVEITIENKRFRR